VRDSLRQEFAKEPELWKSLAERKMELEATRKKRYGLTDSMRIIESQIENLRRTNQKSQRGTFPQLKRKFGELGDTAGKLQ
jgi:DNA helicase IV